MSREEETDIADLRLIEEREKAILVEQRDVRAWLPRSLIRYLRKDPPTPNGRTIMVTIPLWLAEEKNLQDR